MTRQRILQKLASLGGHIARSPRLTARHLTTMDERIRGQKVAQLWSESGLPQPAESPPPEPPNPLRTYFDSVTQGPGIWKWLHYFEIYHRHLGKFVGRSPSVVEVGIYSGGSMPMWRQYFGETCQIHGVDIEPACRAYENPRTTIYIGDQEDRQFWYGFRQTVPRVDVFIDDGGHTPEQQMVTLEEMLPHLQPGGVYLCEDVHGLGNRFAAFVGSLSDGLNALTLDPPTPFQRSVHSVHLYPFVIVVEKRLTPLDRLEAPKHGTEWQPFL